MNQNWLIKMNFTWSSSKLSIREKFGLECDIPKSGPPQNPSVFKNSFWTLSETILDKNSYILIPKIINFTIFWLKSYLNLSKSSNFLSAPLFICGSEWMYSFPVSPVELGSLFKEVSVFEIWKIKSYFVYNFKKIMW